MYIKLQGPKPLVNITRQAKTKAAKYDVFLSKETPYSRVINPTSSTYIKKDPRK